MNSFRVLLVCLAVLPGNRVWAQSPIEGVLQGQAATPPQEALGELIEDICPLGVVGADLQARCDEVVVEVLSGGSIPDAQEALQAMAPEESTAIATTQVEASDTQVDAVKSRLNARRSGAAAPGLVTMRIDGRTFTGMSAGDGSVGPWSVFVNVNYGTGDRDTTARESGFDLDTWGITGGAEYALAAEAVVGLAVGYTESTSDISANGGEIDTDGYSILGYASFYPSANAYIDGLVAYSDSSHDQQRTVAYSIASLAGGLTTVNQTALSDTDSDEFLFSVTGGYDFFGAGWTYGPFARFDYADTDIDGYTERMSAAAAPGSGLALIVDDQAFSSVTLALGGQVTRIWETSWGYLYPQASLEWVHEFDNDNDNVTGRFVDDPTATAFALPLDDPDRDYGNVGAGVSAAFGDGHVAFVRYQGLLGYRDLDVHGLEFGLRFAL